jgi:16S rRNA (adenine1518-N6/adenine1519-N6)-dimethyltransferase
MTLTVQKEVAERIVAQPGKKDYGVLSIMVGLSAEARMRFIIPKEEFRPVPKVDSAVIHLVLRKEPPVLLTDEKMFSRVVRTAFTQRRKTLSNSLKPLALNMKEILAGAGIDPSRRPETLSMEEFARISNALAEA